MSDRNATLIGRNTNSSTGAVESVLKGTATGHINLMNPLASQASFLTTALELLRGDVPSILKNLRAHYRTVQRWKAKYRNFKDAEKYLGSEFLNITFGWTPIINDIGAGLRLLLELDRALFVSDDTRRRRKTQVYTNLSRKTDSVTWITEPPLGRVTTSLRNSRLVTNNVTGSGNTQSVALTTDLALSSQISVWTTARFATGLSPRMQDNGYVDRGIDLLGLRLTPETLWELTPWSWLIDWFSNTGTIVRNLSTLGLSNTILNYAYSTMRWKYQSTAWARPVSTFSVKYGGNFIQVEKADHKVRMAASPFGFGTDLSQLSAGQWSILVALGLARQR
jgi:hypothetical protein